MIDARGLHYKVLNEKIRQAVTNGSRQITLNNVCGQRYIAGGIKSNVRIIINGIPGNDLGVFMDGPEIMVNSNVQDGIGNTMNSGKIVVKGDAGDIIGYSMRGGKIYIKGNAGYRVGIHMKSYQNLYPIVIVGGAVRDFLGEYMAGGLLIILGMDRESGQPIVGGHVGTGMHGGIIYVRGEVEKHRLGKEVEIFKLNEEDKYKLKVYLKEYAKDFDLDLSKILREKFIKLLPCTIRPYGKLYAY